LNLPSDPAARLRWFPASRSGALFLAGCLALGSVLRLMDVGPALLFGDELHSLRDMHGGYPQILTHFSQTGGGLALPLLQRIAFDLFGDGHWSIRAPAWLGGLGLLFLAFPITRRHLGEPAALATAAVVAVLPLLVFYSHFARIYSLVALLCLLLYDRLERATRSADWTRRDAAKLVALTALLPWLHPTALGFVVPVYAGALLACGLEPGRSVGEFRQVGRRLVGALALAGLLCALAYWPARESLFAFLGEKTRAEYSGGFGILDVAGLIGGHRLGGVGLILLGACSAALFVREVRGRSALLLLAVAGPPLTIALVRPYGDAYAYARYVLPSLVPLCMLAFGGLTMAFAAHPRRTWGIPLAGAALALAIGYPGPLGPGQPRAAEHANTYLSLFPLPAFDARWPGTPTFYHELAQRPADERARMRLIEVPALTTRTRHLYRHYQLQHGVPSLLVPLPGEFPRIPAGPYVAFQRPGWEESAQADYLVVHRDVADEIARYWRWVYGPGGPGPFADQEAAFMERHRGYGGLLPRPDPITLASLYAQLGEPVLADDELVVWKLGDPPEASD